MNGETLLLEITKPESRPTPTRSMPRPAELGVCRQHDGAYLVATYAWSSACSTIPG